ncbi:hypothetical protein IQ17_02252 [Bradyrhizobium daqingense]|uniref:Uncharacterized protein n=1 Tax=Bradyrhizobium daqingense TaxID=993502 RepID=A0A562LJW2_9BRAD|nr:hypothetical protein IQ17_02252 [Bradyrhizobium daqingense]
MLERAFFNASVERVPESVYFEGRNLREPLFELALTYSEECFEVGKYSLRLNECPGVAAPPIGDDVELQREQQVPTPRDVRIVLSLKYEDRIDSMIMMLMLVSDISKEEIPLVSNPLVEIVPFLACECARGVRQITIAKFRPSHSQLAVSFKNEVNPDVCRIGQSHSAIVQRYLDDSITVRG